jgi:NADPH:quinone reductase-like Zn-dependent oxidoreductase
MKTVQPGRVAGAVPAAEQGPAAKPGRSAESGQPGQPGEQGRRAERGPAAGGPAMMQAITQRRYGTVPGDVLGLARTAMPTIAANEVLLRVRAAGVDQGTWYLMAGQPYLMRLLGFGFRGPKNPVPGMDVAGTVVAVGADVTRFRPGDEVFGIARGSFAEYAAARESKLASKPAGLSFEQAAVIAVSGLTALQGLRDAGRIQAGQKVLIVGASGGVGSYAVQLAKVFGAQVTGVCRTAKTGLVRSIGADHVIDYTREDFAAGSQRYDLILDIGGSSRLARLRRALTPTGTLVIAGGERAKWTGVGRQLRARLLSLLVRQRLTTFLSTQRQADLETLRELAEAGRLTPAVGQAFPLGDAPAAIACFAQGQARGKIAITI